MPSVPLRPLDGEGWLRCAAGHRHWGRYGAAGLLLRARDTRSGFRVLLQERAWWTHHGNTWGLPGGARCSWESPEQTAMRETSEEVTLALAGVTVDRVHHDDHGGWGYWTVIADVPSALAAAPRGKETSDVRWFDVAEVTTLPLHPGFAAVWPLFAPG